MKKFFTSVKGKVLGAIGFATSATSAMAADASGIDVSGITFDTTPITALALTIMGVLATIWIVKKVMSMIR